MKTVIVQTWTGLSGDVTIKVGKLVASEKEKKDVAAGEGTRKVSPEHVAGQVSGRVQEDVKKEKVYHTVVPNLVPEGVLEEPISYVRGAIKLREDRVLGPLNTGTLTLIHEATHKYAGTRDYSYFGGEVPSRFVLEFDEGGLRQG
jgi:hypothetical protein